MFTCRDKGKSGWPLGARDSFGPLLLATASCLRKLTKRLTL